MEISNANQFLLIKVNGNPELSLEKLPEYFQQKYLDLTWKNSTVIQSLSWINNVKIFFMNNDR